MIRKDNAKKKIITMGKNTPYKYINFDFYTMTYLARTSTYPIESFVLFADILWTTCKCKFSKTILLFTTLTWPHFFSCVYAPKNVIRTKKEMNSKWKWLRDFSNFYALTLKTSQTLSTCDFQLSKPICRQLNGIQFLFYFLCSPFNSCTHRNLDIVLSRHN